jgi:hypothetical protein
VTHQPGLESSAEARPFYLVMRSPDLAEPHLTALTRRPPIGQHMQMSKTVLAGAPQPSGESQKRYVVWPWASPNAMTLAGFTR